MESGVDESLEIQERALKKIGKKEEGNWKEDLGLTSVDTTWW